MKSDDKGFTLVEIMIAILIIAILAALAIIGYKHYLTKTRQAEAKIFLSGIGRFQELYLIENNSYADSIDSLGFSSKGNTRYSYVLSDASVTGYTVTAKSKSSVSSTENGRRAIFQSVFRLKKSSVNRITSLG